MHYGTVTKVTGDIHITNEDSWYSIMNGGAFDKNDFELYSFTYKYDDLENTPWTTTKYVYLDKTATKIEIHYLESAN